MPRAAQAVTTAQASIRTCHEDGRADYSGMCVAQLRARRARRRAGVALTTRSFVRASRSCFFWLTRAYLDSSSCLVITRLSSGFMSVAYDERAEARIEPRADQQGASGRLQDGARELERTAEELLIIRLTLYELDYPSHESRGGAQELRCAAALLLCHLPTVS